MGGADTPARPGSRPGRAGARPGRPDPDLDPGEFDEASVCAARRHFHRLVGPGDPGREPYAHVLEIGAGAGGYGLTLRLAGLVGHLVVCDASPRAVRAAGLLAHELFPDVDGLVARPWRLPVASDAFDLVIGQSVLTHVPDAEATIREAVRVLRPGGRFVLVKEPTTASARYAWAVGQAVGLATALAHALGRHPDLPSCHTGGRASFDPDDLARAALRAGAVDVRTAPGEFVPALLRAPAAAARASGALGAPLGAAADAVRSRLLPVDRLVRGLVPERLYDTVSLSGVKPGG